ncbi:MAG TPA: DNA cytosine methyltransferase [Myxococcales bacterium]|nr:DNA cytosine methyltransferase [Myxococcales bacterium]
MRSAISLYTGAGGMDYGFEAAGFRTCAAVELDGDCCRTLRRNRAWPVIERSIFDVPTRELLRVAGLGPKEADLLIGGPPCQPFSKSGYWARGDARRLSDPRADTLAAYVRVVEEARPRAFVLENVHGLAFRGKDEGLKLLVGRLASRGYEVSFQVLDAAAYGVPQRRERAVLVGWRDGARFRFPAPRFSEATYRTAWDALGDLPGEPEGEDLAVRGKWAALLPSIPEGHNYLWHTDRGGGLRLFGWRRRYWTFLLKLAKARPSWTIQAQPGPSGGPFHWRNRRLSARELCRLQTFPDDVEISGARSSVQRQVGNAVPSLLAEVLGREIRRQLFGDRAVAGPPRLLPPRREQVPPPERVRPVPARLRALAGEHAAHPGTGKGPAARARLETAA